MDYDNSRLTAAYDSLNPPAEYERFYLDLAGRELKAILDVGCGTGRPACDLAALGHRVTRADSAVAMLEIARNRPGGRSG